MNDIAGPNVNEYFRQMAVRIAIVAALTRTGDAQVFTPVFKAVEMQATIAPLGKMVTGDFFGRTSIAAISKSEKAIYFFVPDSMENLILSNVVTLPDTPVAVAKGREVVIDSADHSRDWSKLAVLMKPSGLAMVSFTREGRPIVSQVVKTDQYASGIKAVDLEASNQLDMVSFGRFSLGISIAENMGAGKFVDTKSPKGSLGSIPFSDVDFADFNGDLVPDAAALDWVNHRVLIFYGRGDGTFAQPVSLPLKGEPSTLTVSDLNGNGYPDIVVGYSRLDRIDIFSGDGFGRFFLKQTLKTSGPISKFAIADFTENGLTDIAAFSEAEREITVFAFDPFKQEFYYSGSVGVGDNFDDVVPFYFPNRRTADLVASSPTLKFVKVFKSLVSFNKFFDVLLPVPSGPAFLSVCGVDTSNYLIVANSNGGSSVRYSDGQSSMSARWVLDWKTHGTPADVKVLSSNPLRILFSYYNADMLSLYSLSQNGKSISEIDAETAFRPFASVGRVADDSVVVAAAYYAHPDSSIGISVFGSTKGKDEFIENDYSVGQRKDLMTASLAVSPSPSFFDATEISRDSTSLVNTTLVRTRRDSVCTLARDSRLLDAPGSAWPLLGTLYEDTLSIYSIDQGGARQLTLERIGEFSYPDSALGKIKIAVQDSTYFVAFYLSCDSSVQLYSARQGQSHLVKSWHVTTAPCDIAVSPSMNSIFFLNKSEAYVLIHYF